MVKFKKGDSVRLKQQGCFGGAWDGPMDVDYVSPEGAIVTFHAINGRGGFDKSVLELVEGPW